MSKQADNKKSQGYQEKPLRKMCSNCANYSSNIGLNSWWMEQGCTLDENPELATEMNKRCTLGQFAVKKEACCRMWSAKN